MSSSRTIAQLSRDAIARLYVAMRHLFIKGSYKPLGSSGESIMDALLSLKPEIYGSIADPEKVELSGLLYIFQRLPQGIEECQFIKLIGREGFENSGFQAVIPSKRRRHCYRIDQDQMYIEMSRGRSDIYDVLTHLTFMYIEAEKIRRNALDSFQKPRKEWIMLKKYIHDENHLDFDERVAYTYISTLLGRTFEETFHHGTKFENTEGVNSLFHIVYHLGRRSIDEFKHNLDREISFSSSLREKVGHHIYGEIWSQNIKNILTEKELIEKPLHIISANMHSIMNSLYAAASLETKFKSRSVFEIAEFLSDEDNTPSRLKVENFALQNGMSYIEDQSGMNIGVQIIDLSMIHGINLCAEFKNYCSSDDVLIVMDYAFGEQAYETMDELLKPHKINDQKIPLNIKSINIMGKAGILGGAKGDIMIPTAHVHEGSADNYPFKNNLQVQEFDHPQVRVFQGPMVTVLGTSLQNKDILRYFHKSSWKAIGLEMEGAHYQKAIQSASKIRHSINPEVILRYAYYASDNPLETGSTLASGSLGVEGVVPTYLISSKILQQILCTSS